MLTDNRKYHFTGELTLKRSIVLDKLSQPKDDIVNWLFLSTDKYHFSFVYKIESPLKAEYYKPFKVKLAFTMIESVIKLIKLNHTYNVLRGQEEIGTVRIISTIE